MGSPIQAMLAQAAPVEAPAQGPPSAVGESLPDLCARAGNNIRKREALGCPKLADGEGVNDPNIAPPSATPGDPDVGVDDEAMTEAEDNEPSLVDIARVKVEMKMPETMSPEEKAAWEQFQAEEAAAAAAPPEKQNPWQMLMGAMGMGGE